MVLVRGTAGVPARHPGHGSAGPYRRHTVFVITSQGKTLCNAGDIAHHHTIMVENPRRESLRHRRQAGSGVTAARIRHAASQRVASVTYHFPWPGLGHIGKQGDGLPLFPDAAADRAVGGCKGRQTLHNGAHRLERRDMNPPRASVTPYRRQGLCPHQSQGHLAAALTPFQPDGAIDEDGFRRNLRHWWTTLASTACFVSGKQGEFFSMSLAERKRTFDIRGGGDRRLPHHPVVLRPEPRHRDRACATRAGDRLLTILWCMRRCCTSSPRQDETRSPITARSARRSTSASRSGAILIPAI